MDGFAVTVDGMDLVSAFIEISSKSSNEQEKAKDDGNGREENHGNTKSKSFESWKEMFKTFLKDNMIL